MMTDLFKRLAALTLVGVSLSACSSMGTSVADDDPETEIPNVSMGRALMEGLGAVPSRQTPINYTPRAPLVVPPSTTALAAPEDRNQVVASANWPEDQDLATARRLREAEARNKGRGDSSQHDSVVGGSQLLADRLPPDGTPPAVAGYQIREANRLGRSEEAAPLLASEFKGFKSTGTSVDGIYDASGQPRRRALVEPPVAYLEPAPGVPVEVPEEPKKKGVLSSLKFW